MEPNVELVIASDVETRNAIYRFRHGLVAERNLPVDMLPGDYATEATAGLQDLLDPFAIMAAAIERSTGCIVGAVRTNYLREGSIPLYPGLYALGDLPASTVMSSSVTSCWAMVEPIGRESARSLKNPALGLAWTLYDIALQQRICHDFLDCADEAVPFFAEIGYRMVREIEHPVRGRSNLMRLDVYDWMYLAEIKSPFLALARGVA